MDFRVMFENRMPSELWTLVAEHIPGNHLFLHQLMYRPRIKMNTTIAKNIIHALEDKLEKVLYIPERRNWRRVSETICKYAPHNDGYWGSNEIVTDHNLRKEISEFMLKLRYLYASTSSDNKIMLHDLLWKWVLEKSYIARQNSYPGLEVTRPIDYQRVTTATIPLPPYIEDRRFTIHTLSKPDSIGKCAIALTLIIDNKKFINKCDYGELFKQLLPELKL